MNRRNNSSVSRTLSDGPSYAGQFSVKMRLPGAPILLSTVVTTGLIATSQGIATGNITGFSSRFGSTFDEYRILGCDWKIRPVSASTGISVMFFDEKSNATPTVTDASERIGRRLPNTNAGPKSVVQMSWRARDLLDLQYTAIGSSVTPAYFKVYTDLTNFGAPVAVTPLWLLEPEYIVEFRGIKST